MAPKAMKAKAKAVRGRGKAKASAVMKTVMKAMRAATKAKSKAKAKAKGKGKAKAKAKGKAKGKAKAKAKALPKRKLGSPEPSPFLKGLTALLLSMERRPDRRERCEKMLKEELPWLKVEYFRATDGRADVIPENEVALTWNTMNNSLYGAYEDVVDAEGRIMYTAEQFADPGVDYLFSPGERGCAHSHYRMWKRVLEMNQPMLILEDDVQLVFERTGGGMANGETFTRRLNLGIEEVNKKLVALDVLYLGWSGYREGNFRYSKSLPGSGRRNTLIRRAEYVWTTVAYILWPVGAKKLLEAARPLNQPVDNFMAWEAREGRLDAYVLLDEGDTNDTWAGGIVTQLDFTGDSDIKKSDGGDQGHDPTEFLAEK